VADSISEQVPQVLAEIRAGDGLSISRAGHQFPAARGDGPGVDHSTTFRWATLGVKLPDGSRLKLEAVRVGGRWLTSNAAIARFVKAQTDIANPSPVPTPKTRTPSARQKAIDAANKRLAASRA
jgi:hypothetical protein